MENNYFDTLLLAKREYARALDPVCKRWNLTRNEVDILLFLYNNPQYDRAVDIVNLRGIAKSHVSLSVGTLENKGALRRLLHSTDRRNVRLELTPAGLRMAAEAHQLQEQFFCVLYQGIAEEDMAIWRKVRGKIIDNIQNL